MKSKSVLTKYHCPYCDTPYSTRLAAKKCAKKVKDYFKNGDLIHRNDMFRVYEIRDIDDRGYSIYRVDDYCDGFGLDKKHQLKAGCLIKSIFCKDELTHVDLEPIAKKLADRKKQVAALERLLLKAKYEKGK